MNRIVISPVALDDLEAIRAHLNSVSYSAAAEFLDRLDVLLTLLGRSPRIGRSRPDLGRGRRVTTIWQYVVVYRVRRATVEIVRVFHGARDLADLET